MDSLPSTPSDPSVLPQGCQQLGRLGASPLHEESLHPWKSRDQSVDLLLVLAATQTAEHEGISAAGATAASRRFTALADAELLIHGPAGQRRWPLPPLPAGVSPALLSHVAARRLKLNPQVAALGLTQRPDFPHLEIETLDQGPSACLSSGAAMPLPRVQHLWRRGELLGRRLQRPLVLAECVPGGTTTAQAVLTALGVEVAHLISGSARHPPQQLKQELVTQGLQRASLGAHPAAEQILAAVGDPFQAFTAGVLVGAVSSGQPLLLGGGCQMLAVLALAMQALPASQRQRLADQVLIGTTGWLADEGAAATSQSPLGGLVDATAGLVDTSLSVLACGVRFHSSIHQPLLDYERGYVKEGVGAGALLLLAQLRGCTCSDLVRDCERALEQLLNRPVTSTP
ncbi:MULTISPECIES: nicotinate-nucleotide--dimethylbenzimidazole phosphoribosyltransferase [unclassified Synechococcus]|uniref:nicotinate-nucleotide--dimethylbenzimidazole phosphoribosyltransferase n=1 Tax=unclassified Synechococcus TaxID=2626047 RepID=UPI001CF873FB|nr:MULTISPECIES: nicotinate-nucleotide--dimethylbenzimidazole phosphoribosyltransferase [unclassified Synechococcus]MCB4377854.1 nicotinate-nucleotide--dimethylbenzimidazole phosphoribosyltransferase [Synechococcus sp. MU1650]